MFIVPVTGPGLMRSKIIVTVNGGFGLGLSIVKDITQKYTIGITVESENGENVFSYKFQCEGEE